MVCPSVHDMSNRITYSVFFSPVKSNMLIRKGYFCPRNYYRVSFEPLNWGILLFNVNSTARHTTKTTKQLLHKLKIQQCCEICVIFDEVTDCPWPSILFNIKSSPLCPGHVNHPQVCKCEEHQLCLKGWTGHW